MSLDTIFFFLILIPSAILHEYAHGIVADELGDPTARYAGRLTLNPKAHVDLWGTIILPLLLLVSTQGRFLFAYAKPVPYNPYNLRNQQWGPVLVGLAGPLTNFLLAAAAGVLWRFFPVPELFPFLLIIVQANIFLMVFNLVPIPPLDGSKLLFALLPASAYQLRANLEQYGMIFLLVFIFFFSGVLTPIVMFLVRGLMGLA